MARRHRETDAREELLALLLDRIDNDTYPSVTMMNLVESIMRPEEVRDYVDVLLTKLKNDRFPSPDLMNRVRSLT